MPREPGRKADRAAYEAEHAASNAVHAADEAEHVADEGNREMYIDLLQLLYPPVVTRLSCVPHL